METFDLALVPKVLNFIDSGYLPSGNGALRALWRIEQLLFFGKGIYRALAHLIELGYVEYINHGFGDDGYSITEKGHRIVEGWHNTPAHQERSLKDDIARLETQLAAKRAALAALDERGAMTEAGITRLIGDSLQNGE
jgi:hypothetical protein